MNMIHLEIWFNTLLQYMFMFYRASEVLKVYLACLDEKGHGYVFLTIMCVK